MTNSERHDKLIEKGCAIHESRDYEQAIHVFQQALDESPDCASTRYNVANTLHMLGRNDQATDILKELLATSNETLLKGCPLQENPEPFKLDALYLLFLTVLYDTGDWELAFPFLQRHMSARDGDFDSVFSDEHIEDEVQSLKAHYTS